MNPSERDIVAEMIAEAWTDGYCMTDRVEQLAKFDPEIRDAVDTKVREIQLDDAAHELISYMFDRRMFDKFGYGWGRMTHPDSLEYSKKVIDDLQRDILEHDFIRLFNAHPEYGPVARELFEHDHPEWFK